MAATMKQIANLAGVSIGTVDRALKNKGRVSKEVSQRIWDIANSLGYKPNTIAKSLAIMKQNPKIAVILHIQGNKFFDAISQGIENAAEEIADFGISVVIKKGQDFSPESQLALIDEVVREGYSGLVIVPIHNDRVVDRLNELSESGFPIVYLTSDVPGGKCLAYVGCDYQKIGRIAAGLVRLVACGGSHSIAYVTPPLNMLGHKLRLESFRKTIDGYQDYHLVEVLETGNNEIDAYKRMKHMLETHPEIDVLVIGSSSMSGCYSALEDTGRLDDVKVIAFDLSPTVQNGLMDGSILAAVAQHPVEEGAQAIRTVFGYLTASQSPKERNQFVPSEILIAESVRT